METKIDKLTLPELEPYVMGKMFTGDAKRPVYLEENDVVEFMTMLEQFPVAKEVFNLCEAPTDFYYMCPEFAKKYKSTDKWSELFYAAKNGGIYRSIPAYCVYLLRKAWAECNGIPNLILKVLPLKALNMFLQKDYFLGGLSLYDAICNVCTSDYQPIAINRLKIKHDDFYELYIKCTDMVAAVPAPIAEILPDSSLEKIEVSAKDMLIDGKPIRTLCSYVGAINSTYDLRDLL